MVSSPDTGSPSSPSTGGVESPSSTWVSFSSLSSCTLSLFFSSQTAHPRLTPFFPLSQLCHGFRIRRSPIDRVWKEGLLLLLLHGQLLPELWTQHHHLCYSFVLPFFLPLCPHPVLTPAPSFFDPFSRRVLPYSIPFDLSRYLRRLRKAGSHRRPGRFLASERHWRSQQVHQAHP